MGDKKIYEFTVLRPKSYAYLKEGNKTKNEDEAVGGSAKIGLRIGA